MEKNRVNNIRGLQTFEVVSRYLSISRAADELGVTQSAVSHQIRRLTEDIGERLIVRSGKGISLTDTGRQLAAQLQAAFAQIGTSVAEAVGVGRNTVRLAICSSFAPGWLIKRLASFIESQPEIDLQLRMYAQDPELTDRVADAFVTSFPTETGFWALRLKNEMLEPVLSAQLAQQRGRSGRIALITTDMDAGRLGADWHTYCRLSDTNLADLHSGRWLPCSHYVLAIEMARRGLGAALVPDFLASDDIAAGRLVRLGPIAVPTNQDYYLCVKSSRRNEPALRAVVQWFRAELNEVGNKRAAFDMKSAQELPTELIGLTRASL